MNILKASTLIFAVFSLALCQSARAQEPAAPPDAQESAPSFNQETAPPQQSEPQPTPPPEFNRETEPQQQYEPPPPPPPDPTPAPQPEPDERQVKTVPDEIDDDAEPKPEEDDEGFEMPSFSVRLDPLNWLIEGRLGLELEIGVWKFISFEMIPVFVVNEEPPIFNFGGEPDNLTQQSNGLGPISGSSFGLGFWLSGTALQEGTVLRLIFTNYGYTYKTTIDGDVIDEVNFTERRIYGMISSLSRWGIFTIASGFGIGVELNQKQRCVEEDTPPFTEEGIPRFTARTSGCDDDEEQHIAVDNDSDRITIYDINGWLHPVYLTVRIALGITLDFD
jgi:hypothetical protein